MKIMKSRTSAARGNITIKRTSSNSAKDEVSTVTDSDDISHREVDPLGVNSVALALTSAGKANEAEFRLLNPLRSERHILKPQHISSEARNSIKSRDLSMQMLKWSKLGLYGRTEEVNKLSSALDKVTSGNRMLCWIDGASGTGKTALARQLEGPVKRAEGFYLLGKFDLQQMGEPYSGIKIAMNKLCEDILELRLEGHPMVKYEDAATDAGDPSRFDTILDKLKTELSEDTISLLIKLVPSLLKVMGRERATAHAEDLQVSGKEAVDQLSFAFRSFLNVICNLVPLVVVLDDAQWADKPSLDLVQSWISDVKNQSLMIVACFRSNEEHEAVDQLAHDVRLCSEERDITILSIHVEDLDRASVLALMADVLSMDPHRIQSLSDIVYKKCAGNVFYLIHFMESLVTAQLLSFNFGLGYWMWIDQEIKTKSKMTENVVDLMKQKLRGSTVASSLLPKAACLGARFAFDAICIAVMEEQDRNSTPGRKVSKGAWQEGSTQWSGAARVRLMLQECIDEGFLDACPGDVFAFVHDKVQEAALALIDDENLSDTQFSIGNRLLTRLGIEGLGCLTFPVANLMVDKAGQLDQYEPKRLEVSKLHIRAGSMATHYSAFHAAARYFRTACELLPDDHWSTDFDMSLMLYSSAAEAEYCVGNYPEMTSYCQRVIMEPTAPPSVRTHMYSILMDAALAENKHSEASKFGLLGLENTGVKVPTSTPAVLFRMARGIVKARRNPSKTIIATRNLPVSDDPLQLATFKTIEKLGTVGYISGRPEVFVTCAFTIYNQSFDRGINGYTATAMAQIGFVLTAIVGDVANGAKYADEALALLDRVDSRVVEAKVSTRGGITSTRLTCNGQELTHKTYPGFKTKFFVGMMVMHWTKPYANSATMLMDGYRCGMKQGDPEYAFYCAFYVLFLNFLTGRTLDALEKDTSIYVKQMQDYRQYGSVWLLLPVLQGIQNLRDAGSVSTTELTGKSMKEDDLIALLNTAAPVVYAGITVRMLLAVYFGEFQVGIDLSLKYQPALVEQVVGCPQSEVLQYAMGLCFFAVARSTRKKKYERAGRECRRILKKWLKNGNPNCAAYVALLSAEKAALQCQAPSTVAGLYQNAIVLNAKIGNLQDQAVACERLGAYYQDTSNLVDARHQYEMAQELYSEWGATAKVEQLMNRLSSLI